MRKLLTSAVTPPRVMITDKLRSRQIDPKDPLLRERGWRRRSFRPPCASDARGLGLEGRRAARARMERQARAGHDLGRGLRLERSDLRQPVSDRKGDDRDQLERPSLLRASPSRGSMLGRDKRELSRVRTSKGMGKAPHRRRQGARVKVAKRARLTRANKMCLRRARGPETRQGSARRCSGR
jgi:hypothetical protein